MFEFHTAHAGGCLAMKTKTLHKKPVNISLFNHLVIYICVQVTHSKHKKEKQKRNSDAHVE